MVREQRGLPAAVVGGPKERHMRQNRSQFDLNAPAPEGFVAKPAVPKSKHFTYYEIVENKNKKKKLEYKVITKKEPPPGFEFVPIGNPDLTTACKEISREKDAMIFIVSNPSKASSTNQISGQTHRIGHHIRETIVDEAKASLEQFSKLPIAAANGQPEPIPESQEEYHAQADAVIRDLFPRIPNTDRQIVIDHSFTRGVTTRGDLPVGLSQDIPLARRAQLAVLAHIRHGHTRYDQLLKETTWQNARKVVEKLCLDTLVQWRGDEETGRDQLDEILREVVVISDSETGDSEDESTDDTSAEEAEPDPGTLAPSVAIHPEPSTGMDIPMDLETAGPEPEPNQDLPLEPINSNEQQQAKSQRRNQRGFKRYRAWQEAIRRNRKPETHDYPIAMEMDGSSYPVYPQQMPAHSIPPGLVMHGQTFMGVATPQPVTPPSQDIPIPSIEPISPPTIPPTMPATMPPSFVRCMPPRSHLDGQHAEMWNQQHQYQASALVRSVPLVAMPGPALQHPIGPPQPPMHPYQAPYDADMYSSHEPRQVYEAHPPAPSIPYQTEPWVAQVPARAQRIIMDVNRPGERSNPIVMEDRGGFYERVTQPEEHRAAVQDTPIPVCESRRWSRPPESFAPRQYGPRRDSPAIVQDNNMDGIEMYPVARVAPHPMPQWRSQYQAASPQPMPMAAVPNHWNHGAMYVRAVSQPASHVVEPQGRFLSPRRDVNQASWGNTRDGQYAYGQTRGHGYRSPPIPLSPRRHGQRGNVIVLE